MLGQEGPWLQGAHPICANSRVGIVVWAAMSQLHSACVFKMLFHPSPREGLYEGMHLVQQSTWHRRPHGEGAGMLWLLSGVGLSSVHAPYATSRVGRAFEHHSIENRCGGPPSSVHQQPATPAPPHPEVPALPLPPPHTHTPNCTRAHKLGCGHTPTPTHPRLSRSCCNVPTISTLKVPAYIGGPQPFPDLVGAANVRGARALCRWAGSTRPWSRSWRRSARPRRPSSTPPRRSSLRCAPRPPPRWRAAPPRAVADDDQQPERGGGGR